MNQKAIFKRKNKSMSIQSSALMIWGQSFILMTPQQLDLGMDADEESFVVSPQPSGTMVARVPVADPTSLTKTHPPVPSLTSFG